MLKRILLGCSLLLSQLTILPSLKTNNVKKGDPQPILFSQNFEHYDGSTATDSFVWNSCGMVCDSVSKSMINSGENISGWSIKTGGNGELNSNNLLCFRATAMDFETYGEGYYTLNFDVRLSSCSEFGFQFLQVNTNKILGEVKFSPNNVASSASCMLPFYSVTLTEGGYYHVTCDIQYKESNGQTWGQFFGTFLNGYIVLDNFTLQRSENDYTEFEEGDIGKDFLYFENFQSWDKKSDVASFLWNSLAWCSDAPVSAFIDQAKDDDAINNISLKVGANTAGLFAENYVLCSRSRSNPFNTGNNNYTIEFDVKLFNVSYFEYRLKENDSNGIIAKIGFFPDDLATATASTQYFSVTKNEKDVIHVKVDASTLTNTNWSEFALTYGEGGGYMVIDNIGIKLSTNDYTVNVIAFTETFSNYRGEENLPDWIWNNTHFWSDATTTTIEEGFDGLAFHSRTRAGSYSGGTFLGLQGSNGPQPTTINEGDLYEFSFDFAGENLLSVFYSIKYLDPIKGDINFLDLTINTVKKTYTCNYSANVTWLDDHAHVLVQFKSPVSALMFGYFGYSCNDDGHMIFDNYRETLLKDFTIPLIESDFETSNLIPFSVETNPTKKEEILGKITSDSSQVINGTYSALCGFDAKDITVDSEKWGALLRSSLSFDPGHKYALQFRFKVIEEPLSFFYVELGGQDGLYVRFTDKGIVDKSNDVTAEVIGEDDHYILQVLFNNEEARNNLILASFGGGFILIDDFSLLQGSSFAILPNINKEEASGRKVMSEDFETQSSGEYFDFKKFISGVDVFGTRFAYNDEAINGAVSAVIYSGCKWGEEIVSVDGKLQDSQIYTLAFRYKPLSISSGNINIIIRGDSEKYIALTLDGKVSAFTYDKGGFFKDINLASVENKGDYFEAKVTFISPSGNSKLIIGTYGVCEVAIDDITLFEGGIASFDTSVNKIITPDRSELDSLIKKASLLSKTIYSEETYSILLSKLNQAIEVKADISSTEDIVNKAVKELKSALEGLVLQTVDSFIKAFNAIDLQSSREELYYSLSSALELYQKIDDPEEVSDQYLSLCEMIENYNNEVEEKNENMTYEVSYLPLVSLSISSSLIVLLGVLIKKGVILL